MKQILSIFAAILLLSACSEVKKGPYQVIIKEGKFAIITRDLDVNTHICVDLSHSNCDGNCPCDGMECK